MNQLSSACNICGGMDFGPGPRGRKAPNGMNPFCVTCEALERQRAIHGYFANLPTETLGWRKAIHFADDRSVSPDWFYEYESSTFGGQNSLDLQAIDRAAGSYDFIMANHVLEEVPDDKTAFRELTRILSPRGVLAINFGGLLQRPRTQALEPGTSPWGAHRIYGRDLLLHLPVFELNLSFLNVGVVDPVTGTPDRMLIFGRSAAALEPLAEGARAQGLSWMIW